MITKKRISKKFAFTLLEMLVVTALLSVITLVLAQFYAMANVQFSHTMSTMSLSAHARSVAEKILPYVSTAVPAQAAAGGAAPPFIYSPDLNTGDASTQPVSVGTSTCPNIYCLDFCTSVDLLGQGGSFSNLGQMNNTRGTGNFFRYRFRFDPDGSFGGNNVGRLMLENLNPSAAIATDTTPLPTPPASTVGFTSGLAYTPRIIGRDLYLVTFNRAAQQAISVTIVVRAQTRNGKWLDGDVVKTSMGRTRNQDPNSTTAQGTKGREYTLFSTVIIPYWTAH